MDYREFIENGTKREDLTADYIARVDYELIHKNVVILCHDVFIRCKIRDISGILLVKRLNHPAKDIYWPIGGRIQRGMQTEASLLTKAKEECSLDLENIVYIGTSRTLFKESPFSHQKGTDTLNLVYIADGKGDLKLNNLHSEPIFLTKENYIEHRGNLDPYVQYYLDIIKEKDLW